MFFKGKLSKKRISMKKPRNLVCLLLSVLLLASTLVLPSAALRASAETYVDFKYTVLDNGKVKITGYTGSSENVTIPSSIDGKAVTLIGQYAFYGCS